MPPPCIVVAAEVSEPFVDFATSRNRVLELAGGEAVFVLMLSGDEVTPSLRRCCRCRRPSERPRDAAAGEEGTGAAGCTAGAIRGCGEIWLQQVPWQQVRVRQVPG